ncbi:MAG: hypothetical protein WD114_01150 [Phycisphaerales bacterium]
MHRINARSIAAVSIALLLTAATLGLSNRPAAQTTAQTSNQPGPDSQRQAPDIGALLIKGLNDTDGCLKVITAQTSEGTNTIIAWFEDKAAVENWYYSPTHTRTMQMVGADPENKKPMAHVKDADAPVMVMASIKLGGPNPLPGPMPISQISIELYTPLDAGASINGRLMPEEIKLEHFNSARTDAPAQPAVQTDD